jgi:DNA-binding IclR family transcriptional regulator
VYKVDGKRQGPLSVRVGYVLPLLGSATGRVYLAHLPPAETEPLLSAELRADRRKRRAIAELIAAVRRDGFAQTEEGAPFSGLAAPIFEHDGRLAGSLALSRPNAPAGSRERARLARLLVGAAGAVSAKLGYAPGTSNGRASASSAKR